MAARALVGARFLLNGRDPATGIDCLGVLACALADIGRPASLPCGYSLRRGDDGNADKIASKAGLILATGLAEPGDVLLVQCSPVQLHLLVALGEERFVHAHAGLRRVVVSARDPAWPITGHWRLPTP